MEKGIQSAMAQGQSTKTSRLCGGFGPVGCQSRTLSLQVLAPPRAVTGVETLSVWAIAEGEEARVETDVFFFAYLAPSPSVSPVDGSVLGGTLVTVKAYGIASIPSQSELVVTCWDGKTETALTSANVLAVTENAQA